MKVKKKLCVFEFYYKEIFFNLKFDKGKERKGEVFDLFYCLVFLKDIIWNLF